MSLYKTDRAAYHRHVHEMLMNLGFSFRRCLPDETHCGQKVLRHYWKTKKRETEGRVVDG